MRAFALITSVAATTFPGEPDLTSYTWEVHRQEFGLGLLSGEAKSVFEDNLKEIREHNANPDKSYFKKPTKFTHMTSEEFRATTKGRTRSQMFQGLMMEANVELMDNLPASKDWRDDGVVTATKNQGGCGSCWAFSTTETFESHLAIATGDAVQILSPQQQVSCAPNPDSCGGTGGCKGSTQPLGFNYSSTAGMSTEASYKYTSGRFGFTGTCHESKINAVAFNDGYVSLKVNDYNQLMNAVGTIGPVAISLAAAGSAFGSYGGGVLKDCNDFVMDHAVQLVGYGTDATEGDYWLVRNSWGASWGEGGYIRIARHGDGNEPCGVDEEPQDGDACAGDTAPRTLCGECGILSASSYPTGMRNAGSVSV